jgi:hypothetical protein
MLDVTREDLVSIAVRSHAIAESGVARAPSRRAEPAWIAGGLVLAFAIPFVLADRLGIQRDVFYGLYGLAFGAFLWAYVRATRISLRAALARNWRAGVVLGLVGAVAMALVVSRSSNGSAHPGGLPFVLALLWRGVYYGALDGLMLSVFPILATYHAFEGRPILTRLRGKAAVALLALGVSLVFTATYHLGYADFRGSKLRKPVAGDAIWSLPTLLTLSPLGAPIAHAGLHVTAVVHDYETDLFLPPHEVTQ